MTVEEATIAIERYCMYQPRSQAQVLRKLQQMKLIPDVVDHLFIKCIEEGWLQETFFAEQYVRGKFNQKKWGRIKIKHGLKQQGVMEPILSQALATIDPDDYWETLCKNAQKKWQALGPQPEWTKSQKTYNYLIQKGFESDLIAEALRNIQEKN